MVSETKNGPCRVINVGELLSEDDPFVDFPEGFEGLNFSGLPQNALERLITKPRLSRYRAATAAALSARKGSAIISHMPVMTAAVATASKLLSRQAPHLAFSFNFTNLPVGRRLNYFRSAVQSVTHFCVYSDYERELYADYFGLDMAQITSVNWSQAKPRVGERPAPLPAKSYVSAIGGEGRDYETLLKAARLLPHIKFLLVTRPHSVNDPLPSNVILYHNLAPEITWRIAADSAVVVVPLEADTTCCGHITLVGAQLLGLPLITTRSEATKEYTASPGVKTCAPGDYVALAELIEETHSNWETEQTKAQAEVERNMRLYDRSQWASVVSTFLKQHV